MHNEIPVIFGEQQQLGIIHKPKQKSELSDTGIVIVVGGPQYRIGSHRQFIKLSRFLASNGITSIRFDCTGMGDSAGKFRSFLNIDNDIKQAIDNLQNNCPNIKNIIIWGLCDAATASVKYCTTDYRITGLILLNPWVKDEQLAAESLVKNHYKKQLLSFAFWKRVFTGKVKIFKSASDFAQSLLAMKKGKKPSKEPSQAKNAESQDNTPKSLQKMMQQNLQKFQGDISIILSENDLTAQEFKTAISSQEWQNPIKSKPIKITNIKDANHTFASENWRSQVQNLTLEFITDCRGK